MATRLVSCARHGETAWSLSGQHAGLTSPLQRAARTCELAGFGSVAEIDAALVEWDYGAYEGLLRADILKKNPTGKLFRDGYPGLVFSSGHFLRVFAARRVGLHDLSEPIIRLWNYTYTV